MKNILVYFVMIIILGAIAIYSAYLGYKARDYSEKPPHTIKIIIGKNSTVIDPNNYDIIKLSDYVTTDTIYIHDTIVEVGVIKPKRKKKKPDYWHDTIPGTDGVLRYSIYEEQDLKLDSTSMLYRYIDSVYNEHSIITHLPIGDTGKYWIIGSGGNGIPTWGTISTQTITLDTIETFGPNERSILGSWTTPPPYTITLDTAAFEKDGWRMPVFIDTSVGKRPIKGTSPVSNGGGTTLDIILQKGYPIKGTPITKTGTVTLSFKDTIK